MISDRVKSSCSSKVKTKGQQYFQQGRVKLLPGNDPEFIEADVRGTTKYEVVLDIIKSPYQWRIECTCSCPYSESFYGPCKHAWATVLAAEAAGRLAGAPKRVLLESCGSHDPDHSEFEYSFDLDECNDGPLNFRDFKDLILSRAKDNLGPVDLRITRGKSKQQSRASQSAPNWDAIVRELSIRAMRSAIELGQIDAVIPAPPLYVLDATDSGRRQRMNIKLMQPTTTPTGRPGKLKKLAISSRMIPAFASELDRRICLMIVGAALGDEPGYGTGFGYRSRFNMYDFQSRGCSEWPIPPHSPLDQLLPLLFESGRFMVLKDASGEPIPLRADDGGAWDAVLRVDPSDKKDHFDVKPSLARNGEIHTLGMPDVLFPGTRSYGLFKDTLAEINMNGCLDWWDELSGTPLQFHKNQKDRILKAFAAAPPSPRLIWPEDWGIDDVTDIEPKPRLELRFSEHNNSQYADAVIDIAYGESSVKPGMPGPVVLDAKNNRQIHRHLHRERVQLARFIEAGADVSPYGELRVAVKRIPGMVCTLLGEGWEVTGNRALFRRAGDFSIETTSGIDWFEMSGGVDFDGQRASLPELLAAHRNGEKFVKLGDGSMGMLPEEWLERHGAMLDLAEAKGDTLRFAKTQVSLIDALLAQMPEAKFDDSIAEARRKLAEFSGVKALAAPDHFGGVLRPYQEQGLGWLNFLSDFGWGGCLADDMGLGKTVQMLARLAEIHADRKSPPSLIVVPRSLIFNWMREAERFTPALRVLDYSGVQRRNAAESIREHDLVLTTYGTLRRDIEELSKHEFNCLIIDEAQAVKNPDSQSAKAVRLLRGRQRIAMTGTPVENHLGDLWSIFEFLNPGMLGHWAGFKRGFLSKNGDDTTDRLTLLHRMLRPFILRRTKEVVAPELPARSEQMLDCVMSKQQRKYYDELRDYYRASLLGRIDKQGLAKSKVYVLEALLRLRQAACHPGLIDKNKKNADSAKLEMLLPMLDELMSEGHKALVFSQFTSMLDLVRAELDKKNLVYEYLDGKTRKRSECVDRFQRDDDCRLFLISLKAGGVGLNLTAADYVFILDPWWNPAVEAQAIDRTHRIGQNKHVIAYRLITKDTVESRIVDLQEKKRELAGAIVTEANSLISQLSRDDLAMLLS